MLMQLHATFNYGEQLIVKKRIFVLWGSEIPELFSDAAFDLWTVKADMPIVRENISGKPLGICSCSRYNIKV